MLKGQHTTATHLADAAGGTAGSLASATPPRYIGRDTWTITLFPHGSPYSGVQQRLLAKLRTLARPYGALVGGASA